MVAFKWKKLPLAFRIKEIIIKNNKKKLLRKLLLGCWIYIAGVIIKQESNKSN